MSDRELELYRQHHQHQDKYVYFLLAAAGAGIGFALNQSRTEQIAWGHVPLGIAVLWLGRQLLCRLLAPHMGRRSDASERGSPEGPEGCTP